MNRVKPDIDINDLRAISCWQTTAGGNCEHSCKECVLYHNAPIPEFIEYLKEQIEREEGGNQLKN